MTPPQTDTTHTRVTLLAAGSITFGVWRGEHTNNSTALEPPNQHESGARLATGEEEELSAKQRKEVLTLGPTPMYPHLYIQERDRRAHTRVKSDRRESIIIVHARISRVSNEMRREQLHSVSVMRERRLRTHLHMP
jgi:hypothetical protein